MTTRDLGLTPVGNTDVITLGFLEAAFPGHSTFIATDQDTVIPLPALPADMQMELYEINALATIQVSVPDGVRMTTGLLSSISLSQNKTSFWGFRFSAHAAAWFLLSFALQQ